MAVRGGDGVCLPLPLKLQDLYLLQQRLVKNAWMLPTGNITKIEIFIIHYLSELETNCKNLGLCHATLGKGIEEWPQKFQKS